MEIKTKYNIDDCVWAMVENRPTRFRIVHIHVHRHKYYDKTYTLIEYNGSTLPTSVPEKDCYDSKEELLNSFR